MRVVGATGAARCAGRWGAEQVTGPACRPLGRRHGGDRVIEAREGGVDEEARADGLSASEVAAPAVAWCRMVTSLMIVEGERRKR